MTAPALRLQGVGKSFGAHRVLDGITLDARQGEVTCLIGPSGSGKSTLLRCMAFLEQHDTGWIEVLGQPLGFAPGPSGQRLRLPDSEVARVRRGIGMVFQQFNLWPHMTALGNVMEGAAAWCCACRAPRRKPAPMPTWPAWTWPTAPATTRRSSAAASSSASPSPGRWRWRRGSCCSTNPTSSLDPELTGEVLRVMRRLAEEGMTMVVVTHEIGFAAQVAQHLVFLEDGRIALDGTPADVFRRPWPPRLAGFLEGYLDRGAALLMG